MAVRRKALSIHPKTNAREPECCAARAILATTGKEKRSEGVRRSTLNCLATAIGLSVDLVGPPHLTVGDFHVEIRNHWNWVDCYGRCCRCCGPSPPSAGLSGSSGRQGADWQGSD